MRTDHVSVTFVHVTEPWADETTAVQQSSQPTSYPPSLPTQYQTPQYVDVAATSLKAMIDPDLEAGTGSVNSNGQETNAGNDIAEAESLNETILNALKQSNAEAEMRTLWRIADNGGHKRWFSFTQAMSDDDKPALVGVTAFDCDHVMVTGLDV